MDSNPIRHPSQAKKEKCSFLDYFQLLIIGRAIRAMKVNQNVPKGPISNKKKEIFIFINYVQHLMISQAIQVMKVDKNVKK